MNLYVLNTNFDIAGIIDSYSSFIWTDRFDQPGDFEICTLPTDDILAVAIKGYYLFNNSSDHLMIIESLAIDTDVETGSMLTISGRSLESILDRRIIWKQTTFTGSLQTAVKKMINDSIISPSIAARKIDNFIFEENDDSYITSLEIDAQYTGDNLLDVIQDLCTTNGIGYQIKLDSSNNFVFKLVSGVNRTYDQNENTFVIFSTRFDNLKASNYLDSTNTWKNVTLVAGEDKGTARKTVTVGDYSGLERRELYTDARDIQSETYDDDGTSHTISNAAYLKLLRARGQEKLAENIATLSFEGEAFDYQFKYGVDFFIGDDVQVENEFGKEGTARIIEFIISDDKNGLKMYPTFQTINNEGDDSI